MTSKSIIILFSLVALAAITSAAKLVPACPARDYTGRYAVFMANPWDCSSYYECANGTPYLMHCPAGLFFDTELITCNYEEQVNCGSRSKTLDVELKAPEPALPEIALYNEINTE